jgi:hypothetical protein
MTSLKFGPSICQRLNTVFAPGRPTVTAQHGPAFTEVITGMAAV